MPLPLKSNRFPKHKKKARVTRAFSLFQAIHVNGRVRIGSRVSRRIVPSAGIRRGSRGPIIKILVAAVLAATSRSDFSRETRCGVGGASSCRKSRALYARANGHDSLEGFRLGDAVRINESAGSLHASDDVEFLRRRHGSDSYFARCQNRHPVALHVVERG